MKRGYVLPSQLVGHDLECVQLMIPKNREYRAAFWGALTSLTKWYNWESGGNNGAIASAYWKELLRYVEIGNCEGVMQTRIRVENCEIQVSYDNGLTWDVVPGFDPACFIGPQGEAGPAGPQGIQGIQGIQGEPGTPGGNIVPDNPSYTSDQICNSANYLADRLIALFSDAALDYADSNLYDAAENLLNLEYWLVDVFLEFIAEWEVFFSTNQVQDVLTEINAGRDELVCALYCNDLDRSIADAWVDDLVTWSVGLRTLFRKLIASVTDGQWALWAYVGSSFGTGDCTNCGCDECDPAATYTADVVNYNDSRWSTRGTYARTWSGTPVGSTDSFTFGDPCEITLPASACISQVQARVYISGVGGWTSVRVLVDGVEIGTRSVVSSFRCINTASFTITLQQPVRGTVIRFEGVTAHAAGSNGTLLCATLWKA